MTHDAKALLEKALALPDSERARIGWQFDCEFGYRG